MMATVCQMIQQKILNLTQHEWFTDLIYLARWDKMGRNPNKKINWDRIEIIERLEKL